jgi:methyltransferase (TIGR00027 family)
MAERDASSTAVGVAWLRAAHQVIDAEPRILDDPIALPLLGRAPSFVRSRAAELDEPSVRALRAHVLVRSRFAEDRLRAAVERGIAHYVLLGAGLDTFAFRQPHWARSLEIFELDHAASQSAKRERMSAASIAIPPNVHFVAVDFESEPLDLAFRRAGIPLDAPIFFSWLGVTMYLTESAIDDVLRFVAARPRGSEIVFTFAPPRAGGHPLAERAASVGERWLTYFEPDALERKLASLGFSSIEFLTPELAARLYFADRGDGLPAPRRTTVVSAIV